ncbi:PPK2 family polyphosphate kinase [Aureibacter tunicatorum]|uniref:PPK2 family polyphosphate:nucleotide phosphotransferase n=1 Tax=Aureibacter tunicatorum TaxID=866807 RepID=A0AAE4BSQ5_9BACT|nr:PPK2 family polyphosphate kinase [Aureibacter tunicatorum]MDR6239068.1 PPK2 family polyphosphate:nucleotide phosphotransferase [Aureibacter tunicatorum]BDD05006.1 PPK2 family polyphosphate--nucleotide phosphotransferase [Aureibacter tunicatorum]
MHHLDPNILFNGDRKIKLSEFSPNYINHYHSEKEALSKLANDIESLKALQYKLYAQSNYSILIVLQAIDAAGKDSLIKHVFSGINPQGCNVHSFKTPNDEELKHNYLWRYYKALPPKGMIGIFNRSYYEDVLIKKVHPELVLHENLPNIKSTKDIDEKFWNARYKEIKRLEKTLLNTGTIILKFFLNLSQEEQTKRFISRIDEERKNWKFSNSDMTERQYWNDYQLAFENMLNKTATKEAPWYIIPADNKWFTRVAVGDIISSKLNELDLHTPEVSKEKKKELNKIKNILKKEL